MVVLAKEPVVAKGELVSGDQLLVAGHAPEAVQVVDLVLGSHHKVVSAKTPPAPLTLGSEQPACSRQEIRDPL